MVLTLRDNSSVNEKEGGPQQSFVSILLEWNAHNDTIISTNLHHLHLEIADTIDAIAEPVPGSDAHTGMRPLQSSSLDITEDGRPSSEEIPLPPVKAVKSRVLLQFKNSELKKKDCLTSSRPICVTLMPMVFRGKPRLFNVESIWQND